MVKKEIIIITSRLSFIIFSLLFSFFPIHFFFFFVFFYFFSNPNPSFSLHRAIRFFPLSLSLSLINSSSLSVSLYVHIVPRSSISSLVFGDWRSVLVRSSSIDDKVTSGCGYCKT